MQAASAQQTLLEEAQALVKLHPNQLSCVGPAQHISGLQETLKSAKDETAEVLHILLCLTPGNCKTLACLSGGQF